MGVLGFIAGRVSRSRVWINRPVSETLFWGFLVGALRSLVGKRLSSREVSFVVRTGPQIHHHA